VCTDSGANCMCSAADTCTQTLQAEDAFQLLRRDGVDQSVIICGESGAVSY
jgi:hypothetical protein